MALLNHRLQDRVIIATCLLLLFTFTGIYATYQKGNDFTAAYAQQSQGNSDCAIATAACIAAVAAAAVACFVTSGLACWLASAAAILACNYRDSVC